MRGITYDYDKWQTWEWESQTRYYCAQLQQDIFGHWCIVCCWGGRFNRLGNRKTLYIDNLDEVEQTIQQIAKRRESRGYRPLNPQN